MTRQAANGVGTPTQQVGALSPTTYEPGVWVFTFGGYMKPPPEKTGEAGPQRDERSQQEILAAAGTEGRASEFARRLLDYTTDALREQCANCRKDNWKLSDVPSQHRAVQQINGAVDDMRIFISHYVSGELELTDAMVAAKVLKDTPLFDELMETRHPLADVAFDNRRIAYSMWNTAKSSHLTRDEKNKKLEALSLALKKPVFKSEESD